MEEIDIRADEGMADRVLKFMAVQGKLLRLRARMAFLSEAVNSSRKQMESDAGAARKLVDLSGPAGVAPVFLARIEEVAGRLEGVSESAATLVSAADAASAAANTAQGEHQAEYRGIYELAQTSEHPMALPGFYRTR
ncbi:hypothetical protein ACFVUY_38010 [Kitasatospora sp. NPDC058063]|uniref:hypothetical protein n=1 Tax=unclassified Kitasatospora TaxID=2633591 RepID=UPI0036DC3473